MSDGYRILKSARGYYTVDGKWARDWKDPLVRRIETIEQARFFARLARNRTGVGRVKIMLVKGGAA